MARQRKPADREGRMLKRSSLSKWALAGIAALGVAGLSAVASAQTKPAEEVRIIFVTHGSAGDVYWSVLKNGVDAGQAAMGSQVEYRTPDTFDMVQMARLIDAAIAEQPDALIVSIPDPVALEEPIMAAKAAGIPVGVIDTGIEQVTDWGLDLWIGANSEYTNGIRAGQEMGKLGVTKALCVNQEVGNIALDDRCRGFADGLAETGGTMEVIGVTMDPTESAGRVEAYLTANPDTDGVLTLGPSVADPILQRLKETGMLANIKMGTFDLSPIALEAVDAGEMVFAIDSQQYLMGYLPVVFFTMKAMYGTMPSAPILTGPSFITQGQGGTVLELAKQGIR
jgi:simple sugar transport system substrate-binding protein